MAIDKIRLTNTFGKSIPFDDARIKSALIGRNAGVPEHWGEAHVWAKDPVMVCIWKMRNTKRGPFHYEVTESDENSIEQIIDIVHLEFNDDELDEAIAIFMQLCQKPKKTYHRKLIERIGGHAIFLNDFITKSPLG